jgi:hypothetical protein
MRRTISLGLGAAVVATLLAGCGTANVGATAAANAAMTTARSHHWCSLPGGVPSITLSDTTPQPALTVQVGTRFVVTVPPWNSTHATDVALGTPGVAAQRCTVLLPDGGRRTIFIAQDAGTSTLGATVSPASGLFMPAWGGTVTVQL